MTITFYLNKDRKRNLYCRIHDSKSRAIISMGYAVEENCWDEVNETLNENDHHFYTLISLKKELEAFAESLNGEDSEVIVNAVKDKIQEMIQEDGIEGINKAIYNQRKSAIAPDYGSMIMGFEKATKESSKDYAVELGYNRIVLHGKTENYIVETKEGVSARILRMCENEAFREFLSETDVTIWERVVERVTVPADTQNKFKTQVYPTIYAKWCHYWENYFGHSYAEATKQEKAELRDLKEDGRLKFEIFIHSYVGYGYGNPVTITKKLGEEFCTIVILALLEIIGEMTCADEYSKYLFDSGNIKWKKATINGMVIYIRKD